MAKGGVLVALLAAAAALAAPGMVAPPARSIDASPGAQVLPYQIVLGAVAADGYPLRVALSRGSVYQGGTLMITASSGSAGQATVFGRTYPLLPDGAGLSGFAGFGTEDPSGAAIMVVSVNASDGTAETVALPLTVLRTDWTVDYIILPPGVGDLLDPALVVAEQRRLDALYGGLTPRRWAEGWGPPVQGPVTASMVSGYFGEQRSFNGGPVSGHHGGTDFGLDAGTPVIATNAGVVVLAELLHVRGNMVIVDHGGGVFSGYAHLQSLAVAAGQAVVQGQLLGEVGTTGLSTGPHLHWEMSVGGVLVDGLRWLDGTQGF